MVFTKTCDLCAGDGRTVREGCRTCRGTGVTVRNEVVVIAVPPGLESGARIAVPGRGHAGARGGPPGDLYVTVSVEPHPFLVRQGADLHVTLPVAVHEAGLGAVVQVPTLDGPVRVRIPSGAASGRVVVARGQGGVRADTGERGDLVITLQIVLPAALDERSRSLLREFGRINDRDVRQGLFDQ